MSGGLRLSLAAPGASAADLIALARLADHWNLAALWVGDPRARAGGRAGGRAPNSADSYVTVTAGALAAVSEDLRLGLFLALTDERALVRLAEDVAVADQASGGRIELALVAAPGAEWLGRASRFLASWHAWPLPGRDETVAVIPGPAQPALPLLVVDDDDGAAALGAGRMVSTPGSAAAPGRTVLATALELGGDGVRGWLADAGPLARVLDLRERASAAGARELVLAFAAPPTEADVAALGTVLVPALRAADRDVRAIAGDAWRWLTEKAHLHTPPAIPSS